MSLEPEDLQSTEESLLEMLGRVLKAVPDYLFSWQLEADHDATPLFESRRLGGLLGHALPLGPIDSLRAVVAGEDRDVLERLIADLTDGATRVEGEFRIDPPGDVSRALHLSCLVTPAAAGGVRVDGILKDLGPPSVATDQATQMLAEYNTMNAQLEYTQAALTESMRKVEEQARVDGLTGAYNRRHFMAVGQIEVARSARSGVVPAALMLDIDHFKSINDTHGHAAGDAVLVEVVSRLNAAVREYETVARFGGEEFVILMPGMPDDTTLARRADEIRRTISSSPIDLPDGGTITVTASYGAARWAPGFTLQNLIDASDRNLHAAKRGGRDQTRLASTVSEDATEVAEPKVFHLARGLALAVTIREASPENHCEEVAELAGATARALGLPESVASRCRVGGFLHDVGKLAIPDRVLAAAVALDDEQRATLRAHVELGADIVGRMTVLRDSAPAVRHHHERFDGTGYPDGLAGEAIPIDARIVAAADAWSAITAGRSYQAALTRDEAVVALRRSAGRSLDPAVVDALIGIVTAAA